MIKKRAQQEIVGFVLIVVLVVVALLVFLIISSKKSLVEMDSRTTEGLLSSVLRHTTDCVVSEPYVVSVSDLMIACYDRKRCSNLNKESCDYLEEFLPDLLEALIATDATIQSYKIDAYVQEDLGANPLHVYDHTWGVCQKGAGGKIRGDVAPLNSDLKVRLELCLDTN